jgi:hypothetical protein
MTWVVWRQHRLSIAGGLAILAALAAFLLISGTGIHRAFDDLGLSNCSIPTNASCAELSSQFQQRYRGYQFLIPLFLILPALVGLFWGAPLVAREVEQGTHRLVWTQSITRSRWLSVKVAVLATAAVGGLGAMTWLLNWWTQPLMAIQPQQFDPGIFDLLGLMPAVYALVAFAVGVAAGSLTRKLIPAILLTLVAFMVLRVGVEFGLRPHYMAPASTSFAFPTLSTKGDASSDEPTGWILAESTLDASGRLISDGVGIDFRNAVAECPELATPDQPGAAPRVRAAGPAATAADACAQRNGFHVEVIYQPDDRYWRFQITETMILVALSGALIVGSGWWIRHRVT